MNWLIVSVIIAYLVIAIAIALILFVVGWNYCLLYDLGIRAGLITEDGLKIEKKNKTENQ